MSAGHTYLCASNFRRQPPTAQSEDSFLPLTAGRAWDIGSSSEIFVCDPMVQSFVAGFNPLWQG